MKTRFDLPLDKTFSISDMIIVAASNLEKNSEYFHKIFYMNARINYTNAAIQKN